MYQIPAMNDQFRVFWNKVRGYRNMFFLIWIAWPTLGLILWVSLIKIFGDKFDIILGVIELNIWAFLWSIPVKKVKALHCPKCNKTNAISHPPIFMKHAKCQYCGLKYQENKSRREQQRPVMRNFL
jgi:uncharacterized Zn-finger protein